MGPFCGLASSISPTFSAGCSRPPLCCRGQKGLHRQVLVCSFPPVLILLTHTRTRESSGSTRKCSGFQGLPLLVLGNFLIVGGSSASIVGGPSPLPLSA